MTTACGREAAGYGEEVEPKRPLYGSAIEAAVSLANRILQGEEPYAGAQQLSEMSSMLSLLEQHLRVFIYLADQWRTLDGMSLLSIASSWSETSLLKRIASVRGGDRRRRNACGRAAERYGERRNVPSTDFPRWTT